MFFRPFVSTISIIFVGEGIRRRYRRYGNDQSGHKTADTGNFLFVNSFKTNFSLNPRKLLKSGLLVFSRCKGNIYWKLV